MHTHAHPSQSASLQSQLMQLQSRVEQGEAEKQQLEYQLALAQREAGEGRDILEEREREFQSLQSTVNGMCEAELHVNVNFSLF